MGGKQPQFHRSGLPMGMSDATAATPA